MWAGWESERGHHSWAPPESAHPSRLQCSPPLSALRSEQKIHKHYQKLDSGFRGNYYKNLHYFYLNFDLLVAEQWDKEGDDTWVYYHLNLLVTSICQIRQSPHCVYQNLEKERDFSILKETHFLSFVIQLSDWSVVAMRGQKDYFSFLAEALSQSKIIH